MKVTLKQSLVWGIPILLGGLIRMFRCYPDGAEWYARHCYPVISAILSAFSSLFPFSLGDCFIVVACLWIIGYPFYAWLRKKRVGYTIRKMFLFLVWVYLWFYLAWGMNYFRLPFYERTVLVRAEYSAEQFQDFLMEYIDNLNQSYDSAKGMVDQKWFITPFYQSDEKRGDLVAKEVTAGYQSIDKRFGIVFPNRELRPKPMLWSKGMSMVGVSGYMGPFFSEFNLNREVLNVEYPFTFAHELAHRLGIAGEAEANLYAALVTMGSQDAQICFSGYFSLLGYVMNNARRLLPEKEYRQFFEQISPEILTMYKDHLLYWRGKYAPRIGKVQNTVYNAYLKGNKINSGTQNYSEVVGLLMSVRQAGKSPGVNRYEGGF